MTPPGDEVPRVDGRAWGTRTMVLANGMRIHEELTRYDIIVIPTC